MKFIKRQIYNRGIPSDDFIETIGTTLAGLPVSVFAPNSAEDIYGAIKPDLGPWRDVEHRRWAMADALLVLGMYESSGNWNQGRDTSNPDENSPETNSAGAFQVSYNSRHHGADLGALLGKFSILNGVQFQDAMKANHALAVEYIARDLRHTIQANGPVRDHHINKWLSRDAVAEWEQIFGKATPPVIDSVPATGLVDERSEKNIATLHPRLQPIARQFVNDCASSGVTVKIISGTRTYAEQDALFAQGGVTKARGGFSNHNFGVAFDIGIFSDGKYIPESPSYKTVSGIGKALGLSWGGDWHSFQDEPHYELHPEWARNMTESEMLAELRRRHDAHKDAFA